MNRLHAILFTGVVAVTLVVGSLAAWPQSSNPSVGQDESIFRSTPVFNLSFTGGTVGDYIRAVQDTAEELNIVMIDREHLIDNMEMPPVDLKRVSAAVALNLIAGHTVVVEDEYRQIGIETISGDGSPIYRIAATRTRHQFSGPPDATRVFSIADVAEKKITADSVLTAVEVALATSNALDDVKMQFHEGTRLLIVKGREADLNVIDQVLTALRDGMTRQQQGLMQEYEQALQRTGERLAESEERLAQFTAALDDARRQATEFEQRYVMLREETNELRAESARMQQMLLDRESMIRQLQDTISKLGG